MPFRCRQKMQSYAAGKIFFEVGTPNPDTGIVEFSDMPQQVSLPSPDMTDLNACLKAGVSLEKTNCKLLSPDSRTFSKVLDSVMKDDIPSTEPNPTNEDK